MTAEIARSEWVAPRGFLRGLRGRFNIWHYVLLALVTMAVAMPFLFLILGSFSQARMPGDFSFSTLGLQNHIKVWSDPTTYATFVNTLWYVCGSTLFGLGLATLLAWLVERTDIPGKVWIYAAVPMTLAMPGMLQAMAWVLMLSPKIGFFNKTMMTNFGLTEAPLNIYSLGGMIFVEGLRLVPTAFLMLVPLLKSMDPTLEEAAAMSGASGLRTLRRVTVRLLLPGLMAVAIYQFITALEVFEIPGILGLPAGIYVFSTKIYAVLNSANFLPNYGEANALAMLYLVVAVFATAAYSKVIARAERFSIVTGKGYRPRIQSLGRWRYAALAVVIFYLLFSVILPALVLAYISFMPFLQTPSIASLSRLTLDNYRTVFAMDRMGTVLGNTLMMAGITSVATILLSFCVSLVVVRSKFWGRKLLDQLVFLPHAIPGIVMGLAMLWVFLKVDKLGVPLFGTVWSVCIVFTIGFMSYGTRAMNSAILQIHKDLEEAAQVSGAPQWRVMRRVFFPLLLPTIVGIGIWTTLHAVRLASQPLIMTEGEKNELLAVTIWNLWGEGQAVVVGAIGTMMVLALLLLTLLLRFVTARHGVRSQEAASS
ncbi:MAG TPA: iron ABC transporter permease [Alphaproteobacteria bacterium]|jgi:iron(III) transport system permease protein